MHTRVTEGARQDRHEKRDFLSLLGLPPSFLASRSFAARRSTLSHVSGTEEKKRALSRARGTEEKKETASSLAIKRLNSPLKCNMFYIMCASYQ